MTTPSNESAPTTGYLIWRVSLKWRVAVDRAVAPLGLTHAQYSLLASLYGMSRSGARPSQRQVADVSGLDPMYTSKLVRALERGGLVTRTDNPADPRAVQLTLTDHGSIVVIQAIAIVCDLQEQMLAPLGGTSSEQSAGLREALQALLRGPSPEEPAEE
jgi:MarR family transcriptional regulator, organic hydroperoxide resistance regulator